MGTGGRTLSKPLAGRTILVTRPTTEALSFMQKLERRGGRVLLLPTIEIVPPESWQDCDEAIANIRRYQAIFFTSSNAVRYFFGRVETHGTVSEVLGGIALFAVGEKTKKAIESFRREVLWVPETFNAESLAKSFRNEEVAGKRFLFPRGNLGGETLMEKLRALGAMVDAVTVYRTVKPSASDVERIKPMIDQKQIDVITFFSPSSVKNFLEMMPGFEQGRVQIAVIGETTAQAVRQQGLRVDVIAPKATAESLAYSIARESRLKMKE